MKVMRWHPPGYGASRLPTPVESGGIVAEAAQARGEVARAGQCGRANVENVNVCPPTAADLGLRRDQAHEARRVRDAEAVEPGVVRRALSGASALRGFHTTGLILHRPDEDSTQRRLEIELRNGPALPAKLVDKLNGQWVELNPMNERLVRSEVGARHDAERDRKRRHRHARAGDRGAERHAAPGAAVRAEHASFSQPLSSIEGSRRASG